MICVSVAKAETIFVRGKVTGPDGIPVELASVGVEGTSDGTLTDLEGSYELRTERHDSITLIFSCMGYRTLIRHLISPPDQVRVNVRMALESNELGELEVRGRRGATDGMEHLDASMLRTIPDARGSVEGMLTTLGGATAYDELSSRYSVRGGSYDENAVNINGVEILRPQLAHSGQQEGLSAINPDMVADVSFSMGGFPARYPDRMSSALDITYRRPRSFEGSFSMSFSGGSLTLGHSSGKFRQLHGLRFKRNNSILGSLETRGEYDPRFFDYQGVISYDISKHWSVTIQGDVNLANYKFTPINRETAFGTSDDVRRFRVYFDGSENDKFNTGALTGGLTFRPNSASIHTLYFGGQYSDELVSYDISGEYWLNHASGIDDDSAGAAGGVGKYMEHARVRLRARVFDANLNGLFRMASHTLRYGFGLRYEDFHDRTSEWERRDSAGYSLPTNPDGVRLLYNLHSRQDISGNRVWGYIEDSFHFDAGVSRFTLNVGLRFSHWDFNEETLVSPRASIAYSPSGSSPFTLRFAGGIYYQSPFYKEYRQAVADDMGNGLVVLNRDIKSQRSVQAILGADYSFRAFGRPFRITAEGYYKNLSRLISYEYDNLKLTYSGINDASGYAAGLDMRLFGQFVAGSDSWLNFSVMKTQQTLNGVKTPLPSDRRFSASLFFNDYFPKFPKLRFSILGTIADGMTTVAPHTSRSVAWFRAPAYKRLDIGLSYQLVGTPQDGVRPYNFWRHFRSIVVGVDVFNLLDISNVGSYFWVTAPDGIRFAVPNYLTRRQFNVRLSVDF